MKIKITKKGAKKPITLVNGDKYDGLFEVFDENEKLILTTNCNTDPTTGYAGGEIAPGEYIYRKRVRVNGTIVYDILTKDGSNILPSIKPNPNHGGAKIIQAVQIHCGGRTWDGSHGCITIPPENWASIKQVLGNSGTVQIIEKKNKDEKDENKDNA